MSENKAIEFLDELHLSWKDLELIPNDQKASLAIMSFAASEVNAVMKLYLLCSHLPTGEPAIDHAMSIQRNTILRIWSAKVFEFSDFLRFGGKKKETSDPVLLALAEKHLSAFEKIEADLGFPFARNIRHESTNHYSFSAAKDNIGHTVSDANCGLFMHVMNGNSFYPMGEEVMFIARLARKKIGVSTEAEFLDILNSWLNWLMEATRWMEGVFADSFQEIVLSKVSGRNLVRRMYWIDMSLVGEVSDRKVPLFLRKETS